MENLLKTEKGFSPPSLEGLAPATLVIKFRIDRSQFYRKLTSICEDRHETGHPMKSRLLSASIRSAAGGNASRISAHHFNSFFPAPISIKHVSALQGFHSTRFLSTTERHADRTDSEVSPWASNSSHRIHTSPIHDDHISSTSSTIAASTDELNDQAVIVSDTTVTTAELLANTGAEYLTLLHNTASFDGTLFPWSVSLLLSAFAIRLISLPLVYFNQMHVGRAAIAGKELPRIQAFVRHTPGTLLQKYLTFRRLRSLAFRSAGTSSLHLFRWDLLVHLPVVISASLGVRQIAASRPVEWTDGGVAWFTDLTKADPTGALPILTTAFWIWNTNLRSARHNKRNSETAEARDESKDESKDGKQKNAAIQRIMTSRGEWLSTLLQVVAVASLTVTMDLPSGMLVLWVSNGAVTALQRYALSNETVRRHIGLLTTEDIEQAMGPPVLKSTKLAVNEIRRELAYIQKEVLTRFPNRTVDEKLMDDVNKALKKERWNGRISLELEAVVREDDRDGKKYIAVVRKGTAAA